MEHVYTGRDEMDAQFVQGLLEQAGIEAVVQGGTLTHAWGTLPLSAESTPAVFVVNDADAARAAPIIEEYRRRDQADAKVGVGATEVAAERPKWKCPNCGEMVEEQFTDCWQCGHARPAETTALA